MNHTSQQLSENRDLGFCARAARLFLFAGVFALAILIVGVSSARAEFQSQTTLTLSGTGNMIIAHPGRFMPNSACLGGYLFFDWRPLPFVSFGIGGGGLSGPQDPSWSVMEYDLGGRIFPMGYNKDAEFYLQGGVGILNKNNNVDDAGKRVHGTAGVGYRMWKWKPFGFDVALVYDAYSPRLTPLSVLGARIGFCWGLGGGDKRPELKKAPIANRKIEPTYTWQEGDTLQSVARKVYGDSDYSNLLKDANQGILDNPEGLKAGSRLMVPKPPQETQEVKSDLTETASDNAAGDTEIGKAARSKHHDLPPPISAAELKNRHIGASYTWKYRDDFESVAEQLYGDSDLYPLLVDANEENLILPDNVVRGTRLRVPRPPNNDEKLNAIRAKADQSPYTMWLGCSLRLANQ